MSLFSKARSRFTKTRDGVRGFFGSLKAEITELPRELARRKKERRWKRTKRRVEWAKTVCQHQLQNELVDEHLQVVMTARVCEARLAGIGESRIDALHRAGIFTAYDVYHRGDEGLCQVLSIGPKLAASLVEWSRSHIPKSININKKDPEYIRRIRILKRKHFRLPVDTDSPPPEPGGDRSRYHAEIYRGEYLDYHTILGVSRDASPEQIKQAYRQRMTEYHPDKVAHLGLDLRSLAEKKAKQINEAYDALNGEGSGV